MSIFPTPTLGPDPSKNPNETIMKTLPKSAWMAAALLVGASAMADPVVRRLTPPSKKFALGISDGPIIARFLPGQRFDLQATIAPDAGQTIVGATFQVAGVTLPGVVNLTSGTGGAATNWTIATLRAFEQRTAGVHEWWKTSGFRTNRCWTR